MGEGLVSRGQHDLRTHAGAHAVAADRVVGTAVGEGFVSLGQHDLRTQAGTERGGHR
jgi:hypothetical protein